MKRIILTAFAILSVICCFGQKKFGIKIYQNTDIFETQYYDVDTREITRNEIVNFDRFSLAFDIDSRNHFTHEIEVLIPEVEKPLGKIQFPMNYEFGSGETFDGRASTYSMRYELSKTLSKKTKGFCFDFGVAINPFFVFIEYMPNVGTTRYRSMKIYGFSVNGVPGIKYKLSDRLIIDLNMPFKIYDLYKGKHHYENPILPPSQQTGESSTSNFFENVYTFRLGLMYKFDM